MIDAETLIDTLLRRDAPEGVNVIPEQNTSEATPLQLPVVIWDLLLIGQTQNGPGLWTGQLDLRVIGAPSAAWAALSALYDAIHDWADRQTGVVDGVGWVSTVSDVQALNRPQTDNTTGKGDTAYSASFDLALRS